MITPRQAAEATRAACAAKAQEWLNDRGKVLDASRDAYADAGRKKSMDGRRITRTTANSATKQFDERATIVRQCAENVERELLAIPVSQFPDGEVGVPKPFASWQEAYDSAVADRIKVEASEKSKIELAKVAIAPLQFVVREWSLRKTILKPPERVALDQAQAALIALEKLSA